MTEKDLPRIQGLPAVKASRVHNQPGVAVVAESGRKVIDLADSAREVCTFGRRGRRDWPQSCLVALACIFLAFPRPAGAQSAENVAVVINTASPDSERVAEHYIAARQIPDANVFRIETTTEETIERGEYARTIEEPLAAAIRRAGLHDRLLYLVLTRGVPLRIAGTTGLKGTSASVDSELTLLYRRMTGQVVATGGHIENPYFLGPREIADARRFSHREHDIYLVTRLDGFTVEDALALVDRAAQPNGDGTIVLDQRAALSGTRTGDEWLERAAQRLTHAGHAYRVVLETTAKAARDVVKDAGLVLGYYGWGGADPENRVRRVGMEFTAGSIAANLTSFDARTFREPPEAWRPSASTDKADWWEASSDTLIGDLIREGVTGVSGQVGEAYVLGAVRPEILFPAYLAGYNLAEAYYMATAALSWQLVVVGDPLAAPFARERLTREEIEDEVDAQTDLPGLFSRRRLAAARRASSGLSDAAVALVVRGETRLAKQDAAGAKEAFEQAVALAPRAVALQLRVAILEEQAEAYDAAMGRYRQVLELQPNHVIALNNLAYALAVRSHQPAEALPFARKAAGLAPGNGSVLDTLGWIEHLLGNHEVAADIFRDAVRALPNEAEIRMHAAVVFAAAGHREDAKKELAAALNLDPSLEAREEVQQLRKKPGE